MDGLELGREVSRLRNEWKIEARLGVLRRGQPEAAAKEPLRRFDALRRRPGPDPRPAWSAARRTGGGPPLGGW